MGVARTGQLHRAEDRRAGQRHHAITAERAGHQRPGVERPVAERQLLRAGGQRGRALGRPVAGNASQVTLDLARLGDVYPDRLNTVDMRVIEDPSHPSHPCQRGLRPLQSLQRQHRHLVQPELRNRRLHLAAAERHPEPAVRALQRHGRFLIWEEPVKTPGSSRARSGRRAIAPCPHAGLQRSHPGVRRGLHVRSAKRLRMA